MAGKGSPTVQAKREEAARLESDGFNSYEIAKKMKVAPSTVRKWLLKIRGRKKTKADQVTDLARQGLARAEIERELGVNKSTISRAIKRSTGGARPAIRAEDRVKVFIETREFSAKYTWQQSFPLALLRYTSEEIEKDAKAGLVIANLTRELCDLQHRRARTKLRTRRCNYVAAVNLEGMAFRLLDSSEEAERQLALAAAEHDGCAECRAEIELHSGWLQIHQMAAAEKKAPGSGHRHAERSREHFSEALDLYREFNGPGHNMAKNGIATSLYGLAALHYYTGQLERALESADSCLQALQDKSQLGTRFALVASHFYAGCLAAIGGETNLRVARKKIGKVVDSLKTGEGKPSMVEAKVLWALGLIETALGDDAAEGHLLDALSILHGLEYGREVAVLITDIMKALGSDLDVEKKIQRMLSAICPENDNGRGVVPSYLQPYAKNCIAIWNAIRDNSPQNHLNALISKAREMLNADEVMPAFAL